MSNVKNKVKAIEAGAKHYRGGRCAHCACDIYVTATNRCVMCESNMSLQLKMKMEGVKKKRSDRAATAESRHALEVRHKIEDKLDQMRAEREIEL